MDIRGTSPYPGFDQSGEYYTPRKAPRVRSEAQEFAQKNAGSINLFNDEKNRVTPQGPPPSPRCMTREARDNYEKGRRGQVSGLIGGGGGGGGGGISSRDPEPEAVCAGRAVRPEAKETAEMHKGGNMCQLLTLDSRRPQSARPAPRVKVEASETAEMARGSQMSSLMHDPSRIPEAIRMKQRVYGEAQKTAAIGAGSQMSKIMFEYGTTPRSGRQAPRVKKEAQNNAQLDQGKRMEQLFTEYGNKAQSARPPPEVRKSMMSRLMHEAETLPNDPRKVIRASSASGRRITKKMNASSLNQIFSESSKWSIVPSAGVRGKAF